MKNKSGKYGVWLVTETEEGLFSANLREEASLMLRPNQSGILEGDWGDLGQRDCAISGACLFGANWMVEFQKPKRGDGGARRALALPKEREDITKRILAGQKVACVYLPQDPGPYHQLLIEWSMDRLAKIGPRRILYHLPIWEYHRFVTDFELMIGQEIPESHAILESFFQKTSDLAQKTAEAYGLNLEFVNPMRDFGLTDPAESFGFPYFYPEKYGINPDNLFGVEDLVELKIALVAQARFGRTIPMRCAVLDIPHPYFARSEGHELPIYF